MSNLIVAAVPITMVELIFPKCIPHLEEVVKKAPLDINLEAVKKSLLEGRSMLVTISEGDQVIAVNVLETSVYETGHKVLYIPITGGSRMEEWLDRFMQIAHAIAQDTKCDELRGMACRKGWLKALEKYDWYPVHTVIGCKVKPIEESK